MSVLMQSSVYLSKIDLSNILKAYKVNDLDTNYGKFLNDLSPKLCAEREKAVKQLFDSIQDEEDKVSYDNFLAYFCGISSAYPYNTDA